MPKLDEQTLSERLPALTGWERTGEAISKRYDFDSFKAAMAFANRAAELAEEMDHHPDIFISYDKVTLTLTSHDSGGITERDLRFAGRIDA